MTTSRLTLLFLAALGCRSTPTQPPPAAPPASSLQQALTRLAAEADGVAAVTVLHLGTGERASVHGDQRLPMMSVFKLPLAVAALARVDEGAWKLDQSIEIAERELRPGVSPIADAWAKGDHTVTLETMLRLTIQASDNTGGDKLVAMLGAVTPQLSKRGIVGVDCAEQEIEMFARVHCPAVPRPPSGWTFPAIDACPKPAPEVLRAAAQKEIDAPPNGATTDALVDMLARLEKGVLKDASRAWLRDTLAGTKTGAARLRAGLPEGARLEHKTGTGETVDGMTIATNDVGVVTLPNGQRVAIAVLTAGSKRDAAKREALLAAMSRATWSHFTQ